MHRNITVFAISSINGFCIFLLCVRLWRIERSEILTPTHSISFALIFKILYNLLTDKGRLTVDCIWNTSLLLLYALFIHAADHHEFIQRFKPPQPATGFIFGANTTITPRLDYPWMDYKFIVSSLFLVMVTYNPLLYNGLKQKSISDVDAAALQKYRRIVKMKQTKRQLEKKQDFFEKVETPWIKKAVPRKTQSQHIKHRRGSYNEPKLVDSIKADDFKERQNVAGQNSLLKRDGTGDSEDNTFSATILRSLVLRTMKTQTDLQAIHPSKSTGIQCIRFPAQEPTKSVTTRPAGSSRDFIFCHKTKATNTVQPYPYGVSKKVKTKTKSTNPNPPSQNLRIKSKTKSKEQQTSKEPMLSTHNTRKESRRPVKPAIEKIKSIFETPPRPVKTTTRKPQAQQSEIFKLDDLIQANTAIPDITRNQTKNGLGLDMFPIKDNQAMGDRSLNVLYYTDKMLNSVGFTHSDVEFDTSRSKVFRN